MNNIYKTVWNAVRGQLVVVNETTTSHSQANSSKSGSEVGLSTRTFAKKLLPCMIAGLLATPFAYAYNPVIIDYDEDTSGAIVTGWGDTTVQAGASLTNNLDAWIPELTVPNASLTINGKLTNLGTVTGDGVIKAQSVDNQSSLTMGTLEILNPMSGPVALTNTGDATIEDLKLGVASATNEGSLTINNAQFALSGKITNKANAQKLALKNVALSGEIANEASSGVTVEGLNLTGKGKVTGAGKVVATGAVDLATGTSITQDAFDAAAGVTNAGTMTVKTYKQTAASGTLTNKGTANFTDVDGLGTITNEATGTMKVTGTLDVKKVATNAGSLTVGTLNVNGADASFTNNKTTTATTAGGDGSYENGADGVLNVTGVMTVKKGLNNAGQVIVGTMNVESGAVTNTGSKLEVTAMNVKGGTVTNNAGTGTKFGALNVTAGKIDGTGSAEVTGATTLAQGTSVAQNNLTLNTLDSDATLNLTGKLVANGKADFKANATGTVASADLKADMTHLGNMVFNGVNSASKIDNNGGNLTIKGLTGTSTVTNAKGATLDMSAGDAKMTALTGNGTTKLGTATATGKIANSGQMTSTGLVTAGSFDQTEGKAGLHSLTVNGLANVTGGELATTETLTAQSMINKGIVNAKDLTVSQSLQNDKTLTSTGTADITNLVQSATGSAQLNIATLKGTGTIANTVVANGNLTIDGAANYSGAGSVDAKADLKVAGNMLMTGAVKGAGLTTVDAGKTLKANGLTLNTTDISGTVESLGTSTIDNLNMKAGATLKNAGTMTITAKTATDGVTYQQEGTNSRITFSDGSWFTNSNINLFGGVIDRTGVALGANNTYTVKADAFTGPIPNGNITNASWKDGMSILKADTVDTNNTIVLQKGGLLEVKNLALTQGSGVGKTLTLNGGAMETSLDQFFNGLSSDALQWEAVDSNGRIELTGASILGVNKVGDVVAGIQDHIDFTSGDLIFNDAGVSVNAVADINNKIATLAGNQNISVHYTGSTDKVFTVDVANSIGNQNPGVKAIFDSSSLYARTDADPTGKAIYVGGTAGSDGIALQSGLGFQNVKLTDNVTIQNGGEFALIGEEGNGYKALVGDVGGTVTTTGAGSKFVLGTLGRTNMTGKLGTATATEGGTVFAKGGDYQITTLEATAGGKLETGASNKTTVTNLSVKGAGSTLTNAGQLVATSYADDANAVAVNKGSMSVTNATNVLGNLTNKTGASLKVNGVLTVTGKLINEASSVTRAGATGIEVGGLNVATNEAVDNSGLIKSLGANTITGGSANAYKEGKYAFHNKQGAIADLSAGKTTIGEVTVTADAKAVPNQTVFYNEGTAKFADIHIAKRAVLENATKDSTLTGNVLTMHELATFNNMGTATFKTFNASGIVRNVGTINTEDMIVSEFTNLSKLDDRHATVVSKSLTLEERGAISNVKGALLDASEAEVKLGSQAKVSNHGTMLARLMKLDAGSSVSNDGQAEVKDLVVAEKADFINSKDSVATHKNVTINGGKYLNEVGAKTTINEALTITGGVFENHGDATVLKNVALSGTGEILQLGDQGSFTVTEDMSIADNAKFKMTSGKLAVTNSVDFKGGLMDFHGETAPIEASLMMKGDLNGTLTVDQATVIVGKWAPVTTMSAKNTETLPTASAVLKAEAAPLKLGATGKLAVGAGASTKAESMTGGSAWFGGDSLFVIDTSKMTTLANGGTAALVGNGTGSLSVDQGAKLHVAELTGWGKYYVTKDFADETLAQGSWDVNHTFSPEDDQKKISITQDKDGNVILMVGSDNIKDKLPEVAVSNIVNSVIGDAGIRDINDKGVIGFISKAIEDGKVDAKLQAKLINEVTQIGATSGLVNQTMTLTDNLMNQVDRHMSYEDIHFKNGRLQAWDGVRFWANALGQKVDVKGADFSGGSASYDADNTGFILGADLLAQNGVRYGAAFGYQKSDLDSKGSLTFTKNKADAFSLTGYVAKDFGQLNVIGSMGYTRVDADVTQSMGRTLDHGDHTLDATNDVFTVGFKSEMHLPLTKSLAFIPYVGLRAVTVLSSDETSKMGGKSAFNYSTDTLMQWQMPVGLTIQSVNETVSGWKTRGLFDFSVTPVFGDKSADTTVTAVGVKGADSVTADYADSVTSAVRVGLSAEKDQWSFGGDMSYMVGDMLDSNVTFGVNARYAF